MELNNKKIINAWCMYDWANSVYSLVITTAVFPLYFKGATKTAYGEGDIPFFGFQIDGSALYSYALSASFLVVALILPLLSGIADYSNNKRFFMKLFTYIGSFSCIAMFFFTGENVEFGILCSFLASIGYASGLVFYDSFLPEITTPDRYDHISARGYSYGYVGSVILLVINLLLIAQHEFFGVEEVFMVKTAFLMVGVWWMAFAQYAFYHLKDQGNKRKIKKEYLATGYREIRKVWNSLGQLPVMKQYLIAFFFYNTGVQTVMYLAALFATDELNMEGSNLIMITLIIQLVAVPGAYFFAYLSKKKGNRVSLLTMVVIWSLVCIAAFMITSSMQFYLLAAVVGVIMGGIQSLSRATYSKLIPENTIDHASYFSFYDVTFTLSVVIGTFSYAAIMQLTGSMRYSVLVLVLYFVIGFVFLYLLKLPRSKPLLQSNEVDVLDM